MLFYLLQINIEILFLITWKPILVLSWKHVIFSTFDYDLVCGDF